jgi:hypothetical protein
MRHDPVTALVIELARYLSANLDASDSADGIARWWLPAHPDRGSLMLALTRLKEHGCVEEVQAADGHVRYRRRGPPVAGSQALRELIALLDGDAAGSRH